MITGELKNRIDSLWEIFWTGGLTNPLDVIEQMTYLMFIHDLDDSDNIHAKESAMLGLPYESVFAKEVKIGERTIDGMQLKWSVFRDFPADRMYSVMQEMVFPFIKNQFNAGVDINNFEPVTFEELIENNTKFYERSYTDEEIALLKEAIERLKK